MNREQARLHPSGFLGRLPRTFIGAAFVNFLVGSSLGGWMVSRPTLWSFVGPIHGEINPFGWLTMLIYGMTYAMLSISAGLRPPHAWVGWLHLLLSELAVVVVTAAFFTNSAVVLQIGLACQFAAPVVFLVNIVSAVLSARRSDIQTEAVRCTPDTEQIRELSFLRRDPSHEATDRVAQRGTNVSLILFVIGTAWTLWDALGERNAPSGRSTPPGASFLVYYGWIGGTVLAISLHLFPRFFGPDRIDAKTATIGQAMWGGSMFVSIVGYIWSPVTASVGYRLLGVAFIWFAVIHLRALFARRASTTKGIQVPRSSLAAWFASWTFFLALGCCLMLGLDPLSLAAMHLLFLGFATNLVYGIGYTLFPMLLRRKALSERLAVTQVGLAILGVLLMVIAFLARLSPHPYGTVMLLGIGGTLAASSAIVFLVQWPLSKRT